MSIGRAGSRHNDMFGSSLDRVALLDLVAKTFIQERTSWTLEEKLALIDTAARDNMSYERRLAGLLEAMRSGGSISNWWPTDKNSTADRLIVDFFVLRKGSDSDVVCLQVTSTGKHARERRDKIKEMYGEQIIGLVRMRTEMGDEISDEELINMLREIVNNEDLLVIHLEP